MSSSLPGSSFATVLQILELGSTWPNHYLLIIRKSYYLMEGIPVSGQPASFSVYVHN